MLKSVSKPQPEVSLPGARIPSLDGLRALSIAMVLFSHGAGTIPGASGSVVVDWLSYLLAGSRGVSIFFVISGFLITSLLVHEQLDTGSISIKHFYARRAFRIFPAFYVYWLVIAIIVFLGHTQVTLRELIASGCYFWNYNPKTTETWFLGHTWSLSLEEQFYLLWPLVLKLAGIRWARTIAVWVVLLSPVLRVATYFLWPSSRAQIGMMLQTRADGLMVGAWLALVWFSAQDREKIARIASSTLVPLAVLAFFVADSFLGRFRGVYLLPVGYTLLNLSIGLLLAHVVLRPETWLGRFLNHRVIAHIGVMSYSLYLWQQLFLTHRNTTLLGLFPWNMLCVFLAAELSYRFVEKPFLRWRQRLVPPPAKPASVTAAVGAGG